MTNQRVLVTGASSGIGRATAQLFLANGATVTLTGRRLDALEDAVRDVPAEAGQSSTRGRAFSIAADLADAEQAASCFDRAVEEMGGLDVLVNAAGILKSGSLAATSIEVWDEMMNINVRSVRRWISELMDELGVSTRLQLGAALVRSDGLRGDSARNVISLAAASREA